MSGCTTYDLPNKFLHFPVDSNWRQKWLSALPNKNLVIDHSTVLCLKHFNPNDVALYTNIRDETGQTRTVRCTYPLVKQGAMPIIFPSSDSDKTKNCQDEYGPDMMFEISSRDSGPETFGDLEDNADGGDFIVDFVYLRKCYSAKLRDPLHVWNVFSTPMYILFYTLDCSSVPRISISIKITSDLLLTLSLDGREMDPADLTWILPITRKINRWSQLQVILIHFEKGQCK